MQRYAHIYKMNYLELLDRIKTHVHDLFSSKKDDRLIYHNLYHTEQVVKNAVKISNHYKLSDADFFVVVTAAWFHDIGYLSSWDQHEQHGADAAVAFLKNKNVDENILTAIYDCIMATRMPQKPSGLLQQIICDADLFHLGGESFKERNKLMRKEAEAFCEKKIDKETWRENTIALFEGHHYHTDYCQQELKAGKDKNLEELKSKSDKKHVEPENKRELVDLKNLEPAMKEEEF
jgi:predicted metal-dependent HD superfamily phosphohydrolase